VFYAEYISALEFQVLVDDLQNKRWRSYAPLGNRWKLSKLQTVSGRCPL